MPPTRTLPPITGTARDVGLILGVSAGYVHRLLREDPEFPRPIRFRERGYPYWLLAEVAEYARRRPRVAPACAA